MNFVCKYGLTHDREVKNNEPRSNNGWIYTAIREALGMTFDVHKVFDTFKKCVVKIEPGFIFINRLPGKETPPLSHDEIIGMYLLGLVNYSTLKSNHFVFHGKGEEFTKDTFFKTLKGLLKLAMLAYIKGESHRNDFWQHNITEMNQVAFRLNPAYVYFLKMDNGIKPHLEEKLFWKLYVKNTLKNGSPGEINILYAIAKKLDDKNLIYETNPKRNITLYFGDKHAFVEHIRLNWL